MGRHPVTLQTIADRLGVSRTTVSNAFSRPDQLSDALRTRVLDAAHELGYAGPDPAARTLRAGTAGAIGVVLPESLAYAFDDPYTEALLRGIARATEPEALSVLLVPAPPGHLQEQAVRRAVVDAFCIYTMSDGHPVIDIALRRNAPVIFVDGPKLADHPFVGADEFAAGRAVAEHVIARGRRRLGVVTFRITGDDATGEADDARIAAGTFRSSVDRLRGVLARAADAGLARASVRIYEAGRNVPEGGRHAAAHLLDATEPPDAIVCLSDRLAEGVIAELAARGRVVPDDVAVTGWDDMQIAHDLDLTSVRQPNEDKGRIAGRWLVEGVRGPKREMLPTEIIVRGSTGGW